MESQLCLQRSHDQQHPAMESQLCLGQTQSMMESRLCLQRIEPRQSKKMTQTLILEHKNRPSEEIGMSDIFPFDDTLFTSREKPKMV